MDFIKKIIGILFLFSLLSNCSDSHPSVSEIQYEKDETINEALTEEEKDVIEPKGSQVLKKSHKSFTFYNGTGYWLTSVDISECDEPGSGYDKSYYVYQINYINVTDSTMEITFSFKAKCGSDFLFEVELIGEDVLNILYHGFQSLADCNCEYNAKYLLVDRDYLDGFEMDNVKLKHISINNSKKELISNYYK